MRSLRSLGLTEATPDWRSGLVAAVTAGSLVGVVLVLSETRERAMAIVLILLLGAAIASEIKTGLIPDIITIPGAVIGLAVHAVVTNTALIEAVLGVIVGGGVFFLVSVLSGGGLGGGVMKLGAMIGAFLGWKLTALGIVMSIIGGGGSAFCWSRWRGKSSRTIEFGPFLAIASLLSLFWGERLLGWYFGR